MEVDNRPLPRYQIDEPAGTDCIRLAICYTISIEGHWRRFQESRQNTMAELPGRPGRGDLAAIERHPINELSLIHI